MEICVKLKITLITGHFEVAKCSTNKHDKCIEITKLVTIINALQYRNYINMDKYYILLDTVLIIDLYLNMTCLITYY